MSVKVIFVVFCGAFLPSAVHLVTYSKNYTTEVLFNLTNYAVESRQNQYHPYPNVPHRYGLHQHQQQPQRPPGFYPHQFDPAQANFIARPYPYFPPNRRPEELTNGQQGIMDVLSSIATNDKLRCVPRLLCEVTSDIISRARGREQSFTLPTIPFNMDLVLGLLSTFNGVTSSPIPVFAKAALLGYSSKGNSDSCFSAYSTCPSDPDRLVQYLNNYNGGFFRFFNGNPARPHYSDNNGNYQPFQQPQAGNYGLLNYRPNYPYRYNNYNIPEKRIQNKPVQYVLPNNQNNDYIANGIIFPNSEGDHDNNYLTNSVRSQKTLTFPDDDSNIGDAFRKPKELPFSIDYYYSNEVDLQRPLPNHQPTQMIFPDRTGTGDLRLDAEELNENYQQTQHNLHNNFISFNPSANEGFYYSTPEALTYNNPNSHRAIFNFPV